MSESPSAVSLSTVTHRGCECTLGKSNVKGGDIMFMLKRNIGVILRVMLILKEFSVDNTIASVFYIVFNIL